jgi:gamma-glutamylcysteine synthetase
MQNVAKHSSANAKQPHRLTYQVEEKFRRQSPLALYLLGACPLGDSRYAEQQRSGKRQDRGDRYRQLSGSPEISPSGQEPTVKYQTTSPQESRHRLDRGI